MALSNHTYIPLRLATEAESGTESVLTYLPVTEGESEEDRQRRVTACQQELNSLHAVGLGDNLVNYHRWLEEALAYRKLIFEHVNIPPFIGKVVIDPRAAAVIHFYVIGRLIDQRIDVTGLQGALTCAEFLMPMINTGILVPEQLSRNILVRSVQALLKNPRRVAQEIRNVDAIWSLL
jgi:hypothetical protein